MRRAALCAIAILGCGGAHGTPAPPAPSPGSGTPGSLSRGPACHERYDDDHADRAEAGAVAAVAPLIAAARAGDRRTLAAAIDVDGDARAASLEAVLRGLPAACAPVWYAQPDRLSVQPRLEGEPVDERQDRLADALASADQLVATCDGGCAVLVIAIGGGRAIDWATIDPPPGNEP